MSHLARLLMGASGGVRTGQAVLAGASSYNWTVPDGVYSISVVAIGSGAQGGQGGNGMICPGSYGGGAGGAGGQGGWCHYRNDIPVTPGDVIQVSIPYGGGRAMFGDYFSTTGSPAPSDGSVRYRQAGRGQTGVRGSAPAFPGQGHYGSSGGGGVGIDIVNIDNAGDYGGGGGGGGGAPGINAPDAPPECVVAGGGGGLPGRQGQLGAVRIIWPGHSRQFPSTRTQDE